MAYKVGLSPSARRDLQAIVRYISLDNPGRARTFGEFLVSKTKPLGDFPEMGRVVPELNDSIIREIIVRSYRVVYRVNHAERRIEVVRFWHAARGKPQL